MAVVLEHLVADRRQPDLAFAGVVVRGEGVHRAEVAVGVPAAVVVLSQEIYYSA